MPCKSALTNCYGVYTAASANRCGNEALTAKLSAGFALPLKVVHGSVLVRWLCQNSAVFYLALGVSSFSSLKDEMVWVPVWIMQILLLTL